MSQRSDNMLRWLAISALAYAGVRKAVRRSRRLDLHDKVVLITGGSRGLGLVLARELSARGACIAVCARDKGELAHVQEEFSWLGDRFVAVSCDISRRDEVEQMLFTVEQHLGPIDVLVNNAGIIIAGPLENQTVETFEEAMRTNFWGAVYAAMGVLDSMKRRKSGRIVNITSIGGKLAVPHMLSYSASKHALVGFSEGLRSEVAQDGIFVTTVCPGLMRTGSPRNADFVGQNEKEYSWFMLSDSLPGLSMSAVRAAKQIVRACINGDAEVTLGLPAKIAARMNVLAPNFTAAILTLTNRWMLPAASGREDSRRKGFESETAATRSFLGVLTRDAEKANNELT